MRSTRPYTANWIESLRLKVLPPASADDAHAVARFEREMKAIGRFDHPHIVRAYDAREIEGRLVLAMEYVEGLDLGRIVRRLGRLARADACELARQAALGLQAAYEHGLVHRDIKPSNLMLTPEGQVKVLDLGLARFDAEPPADEEMTGTGQVIGTADYIAPEQVADSRSVDIRADIYSLGCDALQAAFRAGAVRRAGAPPDGGKDARPPRRAGPADPPICAGGPGRPGCRARADAGQRARRPLFHARRHCQRAGPLVQRRANCRPCSAARRKRKTQVVQASRLPLKAPRRPPRRERTRDARTTAGHFKGCLAAGDLTPLEVGRCDGGPPAAGRRAGLRAGRHAPH